MPTVNSGWPHATPWRNYRYNLQRLVPGDDYVVNERSGGFTDNPLDIWMESDFCATGDGLNVEYRVIMTHDTNDECSKIYRPNVFINGGTGQCNATDATSTTIPWFTLAGITSHTQIDVGSPSVGTPGPPLTVGSQGTVQYLTMVSPGLYFGFSKAGLGANTLYTDDDEFAWTLKSTLFDNRPKRMDGTWLSYVKMPLEEDDYTYSEVLPSELLGKSMCIYTHCAPDFPKATETGNENGAISIFLEASVDGTNYVNVRALATEHDWRLDNPLFVMTFDANALDGIDARYLRLKIVNPNMGGASSLILQKHNYIKLAITPS